MTHPAVASLCLSMYYSLAPRLGAYTMLFVNQCCFIGTTLLKETKADCLPDLSCADVGAKCNADGVTATLQEDDPNAAAAALEANFPDTVRKNKRRKAGSSAAVIPALAEAGRGSAQYMQGTMFVQKC